MLNNLKKLIEKYKIKYPQEQETTEKYLNFLEKFWEEAFSKENNEWHFTSSVLVVNNDISKVLLMYHKRVGDWVFFWWHSEWETNTKEIAIRELKEEAWIFINKSDLVEDFVCLTIFQVPKVKNNSEHIHLDFCYVVKVDENISFRKQDSEVNDIKWFNIKDLYKKNIDYWLKRVLDKLLIR